MKNILVISLLLFASCNVYNLSKKNDNTCNACYSYLLDNCPTILKKDTSRQTVIFTINGINLNIEKNIYNPCDSILKYRNKPYNRKDTLIEIATKEENKAKISVFLSKKTGNLKVQCKTDTFLISKTVYLPYACITDWDSVNMFLKNRVVNFGKKHKKKLWFSLLIIILALGAYYKLKK